ncbi:M3 family metallopeptidase [Gordonia defluvii]|jgi:peptidyl-dipeptidase Dcp|uniref:M3 family metallopeptidase n=1 Tax=Gordonia defluvii TaxID=283718 RepID=A0ABP6LCD0_9ACTN|nr:M3 family metallopeptidase [Gordonia sp. UBA5067]
MSRAVTNPVLESSALPYGLPDFAAIADDDFEPAIIAAMAAQRAEIDVISTNRESPTFVNTVVALENSGQALTRALRTFYGTLGPVATPGRNDIAARLAPQLANHHSAILADPALFARVTQVWEQRADLGLDSAEFRLLDRRYRDAVRSGARLDDSGREEMRVITARLADLTTEFGRLVLDEANASAVPFATEAELAGLSSGELGAARARAAEAGVDGYLVALELPTSQAAVAELNAPSARKAVFEASLARGSRGNAFDTRALIAAIVELRARRAQLLGYPDHAAFVIDEETAPDVAAVDELLTRLVGAVQPAAAAEEQALRARAGGDLAASDYTYWLARVQQERADVDIEAFAQYCELDRVLRDGVFFAAEKLYGLTFVARPDLAGYHPDVRVFEVFDDAGDGVGLFLADMYARSTKRGGAWMTSFVDQSRELALRPVVVNVLNIPQPAEGQPTLLSIDQVMTLFHEFGHALHGLLSDVRFVSQSGTAVPRDFVEFPSQVNEHWALHPAVVANYARHFETGESAPEALVEQVRATSGTETAHATVEYLGAAIVDLRWHRLSPAELADLDLTARPEGWSSVEAAALADAGAATALIPPRYRGPYFNHIFAGGYSAAYYAYIWSEVLDAATREWFEANGGLRRESGQRFVDAVLSKGDSVDPLAAHRELIGGSAAVEPLLRRRGLA